MMSLIMTGTTIFSILILTNSGNPMKSSFSILLGSLSMLISIKMKSGSVWMPLVFFILFTGGILMVFMILASILPNEKVMKIKMPKAVFFVISLATLSILTNGVETLDLAPQMKTFISTGITLTFMIMLILTYFFASINLNSNNESSMRSIMC